MGVRLVVAGIGVRRVQLDGLFVVVERLDIHAQRAMVDGAVRIGPCAARTGPAAALDRLGAGRDAEPPIALLGAILEHVGLGRGAYQGQREEESGAFHAAGRHPARVHARSAAREPLPKMPSMAPR